MQIINVIVVGEVSMATHGIVSITSFAVSDEAILDSVVEQAQQKFRSLLEDTGVDDEDEIENAIEDGVFDTGELSISIVWTTSKT